MANDRKIFVRKIQRNASNDFYLLIFLCFFIIGGYANFLKNPQTANPQILGFPPLSQMCQSANHKAANFHDLSANRRFLEFLQNTAQHCLKTVLKVAFIKQFFILYFKLQYCFLYLQGENVCICGLAEVKIRKSQKDLVRKSA